MSGGHRWSKYWYGSVINMIRNYKGDLAKDNSPEAEKYKKAIKEALDETRELPYGDLRIKVINMLYFDKTFTCVGASQKIHMSERPIQKWCHDFVHLVAHKVGY